MVKEVITAKCEQDFIIESVKADKRIDGRELNESRVMHITFGKTRGCVLCTLGNTRVLSQVSCEMSMPKAAHPTEGSIHINVELSPMASPVFEAGRSSDLGIELTRVLEKCIRDSHCVDLEALCIVAGEKVWSLRVDVHVMNHDGNLAECAAISAVSSLHHFRRPEVTVAGADVTVHSVEEHDPIPLSLHHIPVCVTFALFNSGQQVIADPTEAEELASEGRVVVGVNAHQEICMMHISGCTPLQKEQVQRFVELAVNRAKYVTESIKTNLQHDEQNRSSKNLVGFAKDLQTDKILAVQIRPQRVFVPPPQVSTEETVSTDKEVEMTDEISPPEKEVKVLLYGPKTAGIGEGGASQWETVDLSIEDNITTSVEKNIDLSYDDESEEEVVTLGAEDLQIESRESDKNDKAKQRLSRGWYAKDAFFGGW
ncbi:exosome complex component rrp45-like [Limulus polyphemus]|uniref:Exosome complex component RRP45 n=1 Tax=Limulus polyphemus TaxID=6850 RepID=A0ABM1TFM5_LIMPO|nr:exosome complex component rrp45-like [Limulus polyphemus]